MTEKPEPIRNDLRQQNGERNSTKKTEPVVVAAMTRMTRASRAFATKESLAAEAAMAELPKEKNRKRSSNSIDQTEKVVAAVDEPKRRSKRSKEKPEKTEPAAYSDDEDVNATPPPNKVSKMAETELAADAKTSSKPRQRFAPSKLESDREENLKHHPTTTTAAQYTFPNRAAFSGGVGSGSSSSSHFKHK